MNVYNTLVVKDTLDRTKRLVWPAIQKYLKNPDFPTQFKVPQKFDNEIKLIWKINREYPERKGKYIRPTFLILIAEALGFFSASLIKTAGAMQLSEEWLLIHDDIEDGSTERRGKPTLHKIYGPELAINAGDMLHMIMWRMVQDIKNQKISDEFYKILIRTATGQGIEQIWTNSKRNLSRDEYMFVADGKTAYYSIAGPMRLGAILANANKKQVNKITEFGAHLGRCFQLVDDILDIDQDKKEGRITLITTKGVNYVKRLAAQEKEIARKIFDNDLGFLKHEPARTQLSELVDFILERDY